MNSENQLATTQSPKPSALAALASRLDMDPKRTAEVLKATAFKACKNDDQFAALVIVSNTYGLNPLLKELYAFPGKGGEIVPIVSIDGWLRIINDHPQMDGMSDAWAEDGSWCEITIHRKDRKHPTIHREYLEEVRRGTEPWKQHPRRMLKWKTIIQAGRITFGFGGIHDEEEGQTVGMRDVTPDREKPIVRDNPINPSASATVAENETVETPPQTEELPKTEKVPAQGKQEKDRFESIVKLIDISKSETGTGKPFWVCMFDNSKRVAEIVTFSSTHNEQLSGRIGSTMKIVYTQNQKDFTLHLESFEPIEAKSNEGGLI